MAELRNRRAENPEDKDKPEDEEQQEQQEQQSNHAEEEEKEEEVKEEQSHPAPGPGGRPRTLPTSGFLQCLLKVFFGCMAAFACGILYGIYLSMYHDKKFSFSTTQELEREISFQGGSGLYYYYYKRLITASSLEMGLQELMVDNSTVSGQTINAVQRLSLYPELITSFIYRVTSWQDFVDPIYFYVGVVFGLQAVYVTSLFVCSWLMSGTWVAGLLAVSWYLINRPDTSKLDQGIALRENWALPYLSCQVAALTGFLNNSIRCPTEVKFLWTWTIPSCEMLCYLTMSATTFTFLLVWDHGHYVLFVQSLCFFLMDCFDLVPPQKVADIHRVYLGSLLLVYVLQFQNTSLLSSPLLSLLIGSVLARYFQREMKVGSLLARVLKLFFHFHLVFTTGFTFSYLVKKLFPPSDGNFIFKFFKVKFGLNVTTDFVPNFLLCQDSFLSPSVDLLVRLTQASVFPFYFLVLVVCFVSMLHAVFRRLSGQIFPVKYSVLDAGVGGRPAVAYHVFHTLCFGGLTLMFDGMKFFWTPHVCMFAAFGVCSPEVWMTVFKWLKMKSVHPVLLSLILSTAVPTIIGFSLWKEYGPRFISEVYELQESYNPDLVELLNWIRTQTPAAAAVFAGSPQLMGAVRLCSGAVVTSLPLYADMEQLRRAEDAYQVYSLRSAEDIYKLMTSQKTNYVIIEESVCKELALIKGCRIKDLLDVSNGHGVLDRGEIYPFTRNKRFCHEIKLNYSPYTNYFTRVFWNRSYHVYKINSVISFQY